MKAKKATYRKIFTVLFLFAFPFFGNFLSAQCNASFDYQDYTGPMPVVGGITFENLSTGLYSEVSWNFGDGAFCGDQGSPYTHVYSESGIYEVSLMVWNTDDQACSSIHTEIIEVIVPDDPCTVLDCVWPGDTNKDGFTTMEDLLNIGVGFNATGPPREESNTDWEAQLAPDWDQSTGEGLNYKHLDCNGDGIINQYDLVPVWEYNELLENMGNVNSLDGPRISMQFDVDTVILNENSPETTTINAGLMFGQSNFPMDDVYGLVLYLNYPKQWVDSNFIVSIDYDDNCFFGDASESLTWDKDTRAQGQVDFAIARTNGQNTSGYGRAANLSFIIIHDIIDGREEMQGQAFEVEIQVVKVIDKFGNAKEVSLPDQNASVFFVNGFSTTSAFDPALSDKVNVYPNPVSGTLNIDLGELTGEALEMYDMLGKQVLYHKIAARDHQLNVSEFEKGIYILKVQTDQGLVSKRIVIE